MTSSPSDRAHRTLKVGGGFGGCTRPANLGGDRWIEVTVVDRRNFHLFQPLLYRSRWAPSGRSGTIGRLSGNDS